MMNESMDESFSLDEIRKQLAALGYENVGQERLLQFQSDLSRLMTSRSGGGSSTFNGSMGDSSLNMEKGLPQFALDSSDEDSTLVDPSDATSYNQLPFNSVPRQTYLPDVLNHTHDDDPLERSVDALDGFQLREPIIPEQDDSDSIPTEELLISNSAPSSSRRMRRKVARRLGVENGSYVTVTDSSISDINQSMVSVTNENDDTASSLAELDDELKERLNKLKANLGLEKRPFGDHTNKPLENRVRFVERDSTSSVRPATAPARCRPRSAESDRPVQLPAFLRPDLSKPAKSSPVDLYNQYKQTWDRHKAPDGTHGALRREIRAMCAERDSNPTRPGRRITTDYIVPTTKKRQQLVWEVRTALHNRQVINK